MKTLLLLLLPFLSFAQTPPPTNECVLSLNNGFEIPVIPPSSVSTVDASSVPNWFTTAPDNRIEIWSSGFNGVNAYEGNQFAELNANYASTLIKRFIVEANVQLTLSFAHRGREGIDVMRVSVGPLGGPYIDLGDFSDNNTAWRLIQLPYTPSVSGTFELRFISISSANGNPTVGNFLDGVNPGSRPIISLIAPPPPIICSNIILDGSASTSGTNVTYAWTTSNGAIVGSANNNTVTVSLPGTYTLTVSNNALSCSHASSVTVIGAPVMANAGPNQTFCGTSTSTILAGNTINNGIWSLVSGAGTITNPSNANTGVTDLAVGDNVFNWSVASGLCTSTSSVTITVTAPVTPAFALLPSICSGATAPTLPTISSNGISGTWSPATVSNTNTATYTFTAEPGQCANTIPPVTQTVVPMVTPDFAPLPQICSGATAPTLQTTSLNGITGTWSPATVSNTNTATYTFTAQPGQCANSIPPVTQTVVPMVTPDFAPLPQICSGATAPTLPTTSLNGITGTWSPATVSNTNTATYTFTAQPGQCANSIPPVTQTVVPMVTPDFAPLPQICSGATAPTLPTTSLNGISGTWSPATVSNTNTATYTFTAQPGQCANSIPPVTQTVVPMVTPAFAELPSICSGATAPTLPTTSLNGISGTWSPATVSNTNTATYTFTAQPGQCANSIPPVTQTVVPMVTPDFAPLPSICSGATAPTLPTTSLNGISGTWSPATVSNTNTATYTFTAQPGQCANSIPPVTQTVVPMVTPAFAELPSICSGATAPTLPTTSLNGISGTWSPATVSNTNTATYTFTAQPGQCANSIPPVTQTVVPMVTPDFTPLPSICSGATAPTLPTTSLNGISGTWSPATVSNTNTATYTFTAQPGQCANSIPPVTQTVVPMVTPAFAELPSICSGATAPTLPTTSSNGINGTWSPATVSNTNTATYTFTAQPGQCANTIPPVIQTVVPMVTPDFAALPSICSGATAPTLPTTSLNGISGTWSPATVSNTNTATYTFTAQPGQCANSIPPVTQTVVPMVTPDFTPLPSICSGATAPTLPTTSLNGISGTWSPATVSNTNTATYTFTAQPGQCANSIPPVTQTVVPMVTPAFAELPSICSGATAPTLPTTSSNGINGTWSPATVSNTNTATYTFTAQPGQCANTIPPVIQTVVPMVTPDFAALPSICSGATAPTLPTTSLNGISGTWSPATVSNTIGGSYTFTPQAGQCAGGIMLPQKINPAPMVWAGNDSTVFEGRPFILNATGGLVYTWTFGTAYLNNIFIANPTAVIFADQKFVVSATNSFGCVGSDEVSIKVMVGGYFLIPNTFTPNGDGLNDIFRAIPVGVTTEYFNIWNRWGQMIFSNKNLTQGWDGTFKGQQQPPGNYIWHIKGKDKNAKIIEMKGSIKLIR